MVLSNQQRVGDCKVVVNIVRTERPGKSEVNLDRPHMNVSMKSKPTVFHSSIF